jgi:PPOX class probable F420-dependent enzyme
MQAISTPVWFIIKGDKIFFRTSSNSGKIKRIKNNNRIKFAACNIRGKIKGSWHEGIAKIEEDIDNSIIEALNRKYGLSSLLIKVFYKIKKIDITYVSIELDKNTNS